MAFTILQPNLATLHNLICSGANTIELSILFLRHQSVFCLGRAILQLVVSFAIIR